MIYSVSTKLPTNPKSSIPLALNLVPAFLLALREIKKKFNFFPET